MTALFCRLLNWPALACCLEDFGARLSYGVHKDILPLVRIGCEVTAARARLFFRNGISGPQDLVLAGPQQLGRLLHDSLPFYGLLDQGDSPRDASRAACDRLAMKIVSRAKEYLREEARRLGEIP
mmetsp:Transcript_31403/g.45180  ORF Transcript_31403/g.45180 Transcript_31403/m.45180 type:complete len:125 (-) Transcript_31403:575-949(-)